MSNEEKLGILIPTINERIGRMVRSLLPQLLRCTVVVSHQVTDGYEHEPLDELGANNITYTQISSRGVAKNRNNCLKHMQDGVYLIVGDDVETIPDFEQTIIDEYNAHKDADLITFRVDSGGHSRGGYRGDFPHTAYTARYSGYAISFRASSIQNSGIFFDERFGLGAKYKSGEENIFLKDCVDKGLTLLHVDVPVIKHTHLSSGWVWDKEQVKAKVAVLWRMYGPVIALAGMFWSVITKHSLYAQHMNPITFFATVVSAWTRILVRGL